MSTPARPANRHHRRPRGEGQWALGYREPLNKNEENKKNDDGLNVRQRIIDVYSKRGFDSIDPADLRGRMRWYGLYTQRKPGIDGGKTAILEPEELDDSYFMLRIRIDGGQLDLRQLRVIADIFERFRPRHRRHHRPAERPAPLGRDRVGPGDLGAARGGRPVHDRGLRRHPARDPRLPAGRHRRRRGHRRPRADPRGLRPVHRRQGVLEPAPQVQVGHQRLLRPLHRPRDQRRGVRGRGQRGRRGRVRRLGGRRAVDQPDDRQAARRVRPARPGAATSTAA